MRIKERRTVGLMEKNKKTSSAPIVVSKPFLTGNPVDTTTGKSALLIFGSLLVVAVLYLIVCSMMMFDSLALRIVVNGLVVFLTLAVFYSSGMSQGSVAVNNGEIMHHRRETGAQILPEELARSYHPLKGFLTGLAGTLPLFLCALVFAFITSKQMTGIGALPSWVAALEGREEVGPALAFYRTGGGWTLESILRIIIRLSLMPYVNMIGSSNAEGLLLLERLSPILVLFPGLAYGVGYTQGVKVRSRVHADIAKNVRKKAKKNARSKKAPKAKGPIELN